MTHFRSNIASALVLALCSMYLGSADAGTVTADDQSDQVTPDLGALRGAAPLRDNRRLIPIGPFSGPDASEREFAIPFDQISE